jgi:hypothetical protein
MSVTPAYEGLVPLTYWERAVVKALPSPSRN